MTIISKPRLASVLLAGMAFAGGLTSTSAYAAATINKGDTTWMLISSILVMLMVIPGLALFYGGLVRAKNVLSVYMQIFICVCMIAILWIVYGYSIAFTANTNASLTLFIGGFSKLLLEGVNISSMAATFSKETYLPELVYVVFQMTFACITPALIVGAFAERMKFSAALLFMGLWFSFSYLPIAHMVWFWAGPDAYTLNPSNIDSIKAVIGEESARKFLSDLAAASTDEAKASVLQAFNNAINARNGYLFNLGALDFAGGTVVHINAGVAGLICAIMLGKRVGYGREAMAPHSLTLTLIGTGLLWIGWFGFNAGSNLEANGLTALVILNTLVATAAATLAWTLGERFFRGHASLLGAASGAVAGLVAITPACGWVGPIGAISIGFVGGLICLWSVTWLKAKLGYDDALDVFGVHGVGGIVGALLTGVFVNPALGGMGITNYLATDTSATLFEYSLSGQMFAQIMAVAIAVLWSAAVSVIALLICKYVTGLRVSESEEREGLDIRTHGERAYNA